MQHCRFISSAIPKQAQNCMCCTSAFFPADLLMRSHVTCKALQLLFLLSFCDVCCLDSSLHLLGYSLDSTSSRMSFICLPSALLLPVCAGSMVQYDVTCNPLQLLSLLVPLCGMATGSISFWISPSTMPAQRQHASHLHMQGISLIGADFLLRSL